MNETKDRNRYPYSLENAFLISINIKRKKELPEIIEMPINIETKVSKPEFPRLQIIMRASNQEDSPIPFQFEIVGLFKHLGEEEEYNKDDGKEFVFDRGLHMLWPYLSQMVRIITGQMGMNPINIKTPISYLSNTPDEK